MLDESNANIRKEKLVQINKGVLKKITLNVSLNFKLR